MAKKDVNLDVRINSRDGVELVHTMNKYNDKDQSPILSGENKIKVSIQNILQPWWRIYKNFQPFEKNKIQNIKKQG